MVCQISGGVGGRGGHRRWRRGGRLGAGSPRWRHGVERVWSTCTVQDLDMHDAEVAAAAEAGLLMNEDDN